MSILVAILFMLLSFGLGGFATYIWFQGELDRLTCEVDKQDKLFAANLKLSTEKSRLESRLANWRSVYDRDLESRTLEVKEKAAKTVAELEAENWRLKQRIGVSNAS